MASTIGWAVPLLLLLPFLVFVIMVTGVRGRRATSNLAGFGLLLMLADVALVGWARLRVPGPYRTAYQWINVPTSFTGAQAFQGFGIDISIRVDHAALAVVATLTLVTLLAVFWHRGAGRQEAGPARVHALLALGLLGACGVALSSDLAAITGWWGLVGVATYLLVASRAGTETAGRVSQRGLALPFLGDAALLAGVAILYSRYGQLDLDKLTYTLLRSTYGTGLVAIGVAAALLGLAVVARGGLFPFTGWMTGTVDTPPAVAAWVQGTWTVLPVVLMAKVLPLFVAAGPQPFRIAAYVAAGAALAGAAVSLADNDPRRALTWAGSSVVALLLLGLGQPDAVVPGLAGALAAGIARPVAAGAMASIAAAMRSDDLAAMGEAWTRMRLTALALGAALVALALAAVPKAAAMAGWRNAWLIAALLVLAGAALLRPYAAAALLRLPRRRAFEPTRVREVAPLLAGTGIVGAAAAAVALALAFLPAWLGFLRGAPQPAPAVGVVLLWLGVGLAGPAAALALVVVRGRALVELSGRAQAMVSGRLAAAALVADGAWRAGLGMVGGVEERGLEAGERALGGALAGLGRPVLPAGAALALTVCALVGLAVAGALLAPGVAR